MRNGVRRTILTIPLLLCPVGLMGQTVNKATYVYDSLGRLTQAGYPGASLTYSYDNAGNRTSETIGPPILSCNNLYWGGQVRQVGSMSISCSDRNGNSYSIISVTQPTSPNGLTVTFSGTQLTVTDSVYAQDGQFAFTFTAQDVQGNQAVATVNGVNEY